MAAPIPDEILKRRADTGLIIAFVIFLLLPTVDSFLGLDRTPTPNENRAPATMPVFKPTLHGAGEYLSGLEKYFNDHFGFRKRLVRWEQRWKYQIFRQSKPATALEGKDGWLYFTGGLMVDDTLGNKPFTDGELEAWRALLCERRDWLAARGIRYLFVVPPDKHTVYPEYLPDWLSNGRRPPHRLDQFIAHMREHSDVPVLDLRPALLEGKREAQVYQKTDTHWTDIGAYIGYREILRNLASLGIVREPHPLTAFTATPTDVPAGDIARMLGQESLLMEKGRIFLSPASPLGDIPSRKAPELLPKKWIPETEPRITENLEREGKVLFFRDSFTVQLVPFFAQHFRTAIYIWQQNWDRDLIERERPDVVVDEMLERFVLYRDPATLREAEKKPEVQLFGDR